MSARGLRMTIPIGRRALFVSSRLRRALLAAALAAGMPGLCSCARRPARPSVLLITVDTLRADHLGAYGYTRPTSPRIDALAREGVLFEKAFATVPRTTQSVATILTGLYPKHHRARGLFSILPEANVTLAEILRGEGYATWAVVSNIFLQPGKGFEQGFDSYSNPRQRFDGDSSAQITDEALGKLRQAPERPFLLWVHYLDPHWSYQPEGRFATLFDPDYRPGAAMRELAGQQKGDIIFHNRLAPEDRRHLVALYDGEIAQVDEQVGRLLDGIPPPLRARLLVILASDHGESLCEHDVCFAHGETLYEDTLRVPLIVALPGRLAPGRFGGAVSLMDLAPTVLSLVGVGQRMGMDGVALLSERGERLPAAAGREFLFAETDYQLIHAANPRYFIPGVEGRWSGIRRGEEKLIRIPRPEGALQEAFQLATDPGETRPLEPAGLARGGEMARALEGWIDFEPGAGESPEASLTPEQKERLRSLGYLQ